ncbi:hypothetical protein DUNSADRAFT_10774 [Dunaliella salina]|uniref:Uncharacterized protein n=1 Tax=Dunaliella salina TaxID=3046 RepID=A0ABQ7GEJ3_DUNSA|nr:hypothetical protein DUNSADRAFT_10774 [Dunaliella salina]|eukprot:KAF5833028.1 hypothetical protein DUNSADRAFT_10774 [Dunaliella salina]
MQGQPPPPPAQQPIEHQREPCPDRIIDDIGGAFAMGCVGGGAWHLVKGFKGSPTGFRTKSALESVRKESPRLGGSFANWGLTFSMFDCSLQYLRKKEDPYNAIAAGALTGGFLQLRHGLKSAAKSAAFGGGDVGLSSGGDKATSSGDGSLWSWLGLGGEQKPPAPQGPSDLSNDPFAPPPMPKEFMSDGTKE